MLSIILSILLMVVGFLLMFVILLQRGRGGGLAGALGGMGGQSAFGTKAGDVFTKITVGMAVVWVVLSGVTGMAMFSDSQGRYQNAGVVSPEEIGPINDSGNAAETAPSLPDDAGAADSATDNSSDKKDGDRKDKDKKSPDKQDESPKSDPAK